MPRLFRRDFLLAWGGFAAGVLAMISASMSVGREEPAAVTSPRWGGPVTVAVAALLLVGVTVLQGRWTDRWVEKRVSEKLTRNARLLEERFPATFGDWELEKELESDPKELERAGAVGHVSKVYRNVRTKALVSAFVVCATPYDASGHTPDRCYPGAGFEVAETEHRLDVPLIDGRKAEAFTGTFRKQGQTLRVFWTYGVDGTWVAPQIARIELAGAESVFKLYAIIDETRLKSAQSTLECTDFLSTLLPALNASVAAESGGGSGSDSPSPSVDEPGALPATVEAGKVGVRTASDTVHGSVG